MANQYTGSLDHKVRQKFGCSALELLQQALAEDLSYNEVQAKLGVTQGTVRKWARRFGVELRSDGSCEVEEDKSHLFFSPEINSYNFLSRRWHDYHAN
ncbi:MAG: hypothetical protein K0R66_1267 [Gammaproteobacteria bacterium]|nr:hypothetical protein [Gammaproteobacteria bacterium]